MSCNLITAVGAKIRATIRSLGLRPLSPRE